MTHSYHGFISHDLNHVIKPPFTINRDSIQARGLKFWVPAHSLEYQDIAGFKPITVNSDTLLGSSDQGRLVWEATTSSEFAVVPDTANGDCDFGLADPFTLCAWINMVGPTAGGTIISKAGATGAARQYQMYCDASNFMKCRVHGTTISSTVDVRDAGMKLVTVTKSGTESSNDVSYYIDGALVATGTAGADLTNNADVVLGARRGGDSNDGIGFTMDVGSSAWDFRIYDVALLAEEVAHIFEHPSDLALPPTHAPYVSVAAEAPSSSAGAAVYHYQHHMETNM